MIRSFELKKSEKQQQQQQQQKKERAESFKNKHHINFIEYIKIYGPWSLWFPKVTANLKSYL